MAGWTVIAGWKGVAAGAALVVAAGAGVWAYGALQYRAGERAADARHDLAVAQMTAQAQADARAAERRMQDNIEEVQRNAQDQIAAADADRATADAAAGRLRSEIARLRASVAASNTGTATGSPAGTDALDLLADLLSRADGRAGELAAVADRARVAGLACEAAYDGVRSGR